MASRRLHRFPSLFLDADITPGVRRILECAGFSCVSANDAAVRTRLPQGTADWDVLAEARRRRRVLVCLDKHADQRTRYTWSEQLEARGGRVIQITGGPEQPPIEAAAKALIHYEAWQTFFSGQDTAVATLGKTANPRLLGRQEIFKLSPATLRQIDTPVEPRRSGSRTSQRARPAPQDQQLPLDGN